MKSALKNIDDIIFMETLADLMISKASEIKMNCRQARQKLEDVSTSSVRKGLSQEQIAKVLARREKLFAKK